MECNREEAIRALDLAETKFKDGQYETAMRFALKAQGLYPSLPNLVQTLTAYQVHVAAVSKRLASGETDWHAVLDVDPSADHDTIRKQYLKMSRLTHPDKNRTSAASEGAFKLVKQALDMLSSPNNAEADNDNNEDHESAETETDEEHKEEEEEEEEEEVWEDLEVELKCHRCDLRRCWEFRRLGDKYLRHKCKNCKTWYRISNKLACAEVPLPCKNCHRNVRWGSYQPTGFECRSCASYYVVGVHPDWMPRSLSSRSSRFSSRTVSCPFCEFPNKYQQVDVDDVDDDDDDGRFSSTVSIGCDRCGLRSIIVMGIEDIRK